MKWFFIFLYPEFQSWQWEGGFEKAFMEIKSNKLIKSENVLVASQKCIWDWVGTLGL